jgi:serine/threonine-protein kinase
VVLVEMMTGHRPFENSPSLRAEYHLPPDFANQPVLDAVLQRCLATAPGERFPSAAKLHSALIPALRACN